MCGTVRTPKRVRSAPANAEFSTLRTNGVRQLIWSQRSARHGCLYFDRDRARATRRTTAPRSESTKQLAENGRDATRPDGTLVLVVDDEATLREAIAYNLKREGWAVEQADNGTTALARARALKPDLIVLDVMLPGMDGLQVCRALRAESTVPILFLSARTEEVDRILGLELGGDDYLTKPFAMRELVARARAMIRRAQMVPVAAGGTGLGRDTRCRNPGPIRTCPGRPKECSFPAIFRWTSRAGPSNSTVSRSP